MAPGLVVRMGVILTCGICFSVHVTFAGSVTGVIRGAENAASVSGSVTKAGGDMLPGSGNLAGGFFAGGAGPSLKMGAERTALSWTENLKSQTASFRQFLVSLGIARQKNENLRVFGPNSGVYNMPGDGTKMRTGLRAAEHLSVKFRKDLYLYLREFDTGKETHDRLREAPETGGLFWSQGVMSARELAVTGEMNKTLLDPVPARNLDDKSAERKLAEDYGAVRKVKEAKLLIPGAVLSDLTASRVPAIEAEEWLAQTYGRMGGRGENPVSKNGKTSLNGLTAMLVNMRFANQEWNTGKRGIHGKTAAGVLREILQMRLDRLMTEYRKMIWLDRLAALMAQKQMSMNDRFNRILNKIKNRAYK